LGELNGAREEKRLGGKMEKMWDWN
jgi:hypothetical protein